MRRSEIRSATPNPIIFVLQACYGGAAFTVAMGCEAVIGSLQRAGAWTGMLSAWRPRRAPTIERRSIDAPQFSRKTLLKMIDVWTDWATSDRCTSPTGALEHAAYYRAILDDLDRRRLASEAVVTRLPPSISAVMRDKRRDTRAPSYALQAHDIEPVDCGIDRRQTAPYGPTFTIAPPRRDDSARYTA